MSVGIGLSGVLSINTGTVSTPVYTVVGGQRSSTLTFNAESVDATSKSNAGWRSTLPTTRGVSIETQGVVDENDNGFLALREVFFTSGATPKLYRFTTPGGVTYSGSFSLSSIDESYPFDDVVGFSFTLDSVGVVSKA